MKKRNLLVLSIAALSTFAIAGCGTTNTNREAELEEKITKLEQQIATLEAEKNENAATNNSNTTNDSNQTNETGVTDNNGTITNAGTTNQDATDDNITGANTADTNKTDENRNTTTDVSSYSVESLTKEVDKIIEKMEKATPSKDTEKKRTEFYTFKDEANVVEDRIDDYDDYLEAQYKQGSMTYEDYRKKEKELDALEERLDKAEDKLERTFGMDD